MLIAKPLSVGETLEKLLRERGMNQTEASAKIGVTRQYLNAVINGKLPLTTELQWKLKPVIEKGLDYWTEIGKSYDQYLTTPEGRRHFLEAKEEDLIQQFDLHGQHVLVNYEVEAAVEAGVIGMTVSGKPAFQKDRQGATGYLLSIGDEAEVFSPNGTRRVASTWPHLDLLPGERVRLMTLECLELGGRMRAHLHGLCDPFPGIFVQFVGSTVLEPWHGVQVSMPLIHLGSEPARLVRGQPGLKVSFEYLATEAARPPAASL